MTTNTLTASTTGIATAGGNDGTLTIQTGPAGSLVNAITINSAGQATLLSPLVAGATITLGTAQATTSGTSILFTGIPATAKRVTVNFKGVGTSGTSIKQVQIGSGSVTTTGYTATCSLISGTGSATLSTASTGFVIESQVAANRIHGQMVLTLENSATNTWVESHNAAVTDLPGTLIGSGSIALSGALDRINITTVNGTDTFAAGEINVMWE